MARRRTGFQKKIETVHWTGAAGQFINQAAGAAAGILNAAQHLPETLLRIRGEYVASLDSGLGSSVGAQLSIGIIQVPEGTGSTVLWSPFTDADAPWIWWDSFSMMYFEFVTDAVASVNAANGRRVIDSKAMRKLRNTEIQLVVENTTIPGLTATSIHTNLNVRILSGS